MPFFFFIVISLVIRLGINHSAKVTCLMSPKLTMDSQLFDGVIFLVLDDSPIFSLLHYVSVTYYLKN